MGNFWAQVFTVSLSLFLLMDGIGNIPLFIALLKDVPARRQKIVIARELIIALLIILLFEFFGASFLNLLEVKEHTILIAGGIILFLIALKMIFPSRADAEIEQREKEPFIVPLAIPLVAGPAVLAAVILYSNQRSSLVTVTAIFISWVATLIILLSSSFLKKILGWRGITACERLMGLLLTLIAVQMLLQGIGSFIAHLPRP